MTRPTDGALRPRATAAPQVEIEDPRSPEARGLGIGGAILQAIERRARQLGLGELKLETGTAQPEALGLYRAAGYRPCAAFADYRPDPLNLFLAKPLVDGLRRH